MSERPRKDDDDFFEEFIKPEVAVSQAEEAHRAEVNMRRNEQTETKLQQNTVVLLRSIYGALVAIFFLLMWVFFWR